MRLIIVAILFLQTAPLWAAPINLALNKKAKASSVEVQNTNALSAAKAFDGINYNGPYKGQRNRWATDWQKDINRDSGWIFVDLGAKTLFDSLAIFWEHSGAKKYDVQVWTSEIDTPSYQDDVRWKTIYTDTSLKYNDTLEACLRFKKLNTTEARYVRIRGYKRIFDFGYSIFEFEIYNTTGSIPVQQHLPITNHFTLCQFNDYVSIAVDGSSDKLEGQIFSSNGQIVDKIYPQNGKLHELIWDYRNKDHKKITNGIYIINISNHQQLLGTRMIEILK